jgi:nucleotide-binding universal stress UspA family protein
MKIERILVATDLSRAARAAYPHAAAIAQRFGAKVLLTHVNEAAGFGFSSSKDLVAFLSAVGERIARQLAEERAVLEGLGVEVAVFEEVGTPSQEILKTAEREGASLVVLTRVGQSHHRHFAVGSTARKVVRHVGVPLLVVPVEEGSQAEFRGYRKLLATTDFSDDAQRGLVAAVELAAAFEARVVVTHVLRLPTLAPTLPGEPAIYFPTQSAESIQQHFERELERAGQNIGDERLSHTLTIGSGSTADAICGMATDEDADLIVIPSHGKGAVRAVLFGSTSEHVLRVADRPILVLPRDWLKANYELAPAPD